MKPPESMSAVSYELLSDEEEELTQCAAQAESALSALSRALVAAEAVPIDKAVEAQAQLRACTLVAEAARRASREFELEVYQGGSSETCGITSGAGAVFRAQQMECSRRLQQLLGTLDFVRATRQRELLLGGQRAGVGTGAAGSSASSTADTDRLSPAALLALGAKVQTESAASVARMTRLVEASREVGSSTLHALEGQRSRLERVRQTVTAQVFQFEMAEKELVEFTQFALSDNITTLLLILIVCSLAVVGVWRISMSGSIDTNVVHAGMAGAGAGEKGAGTVHGVARGWSTEVYSALDLRTW